MNCIEGIIHTTLVKGLWNWEIYRFCCNESITKISSFNLCKFSLVREAFQKKTEDLVNSALKEGGYLTWITILNNNEIVKRGRGVEEKDTCKKLKIIMENNSITLNVYIWCFIWVQFSLCALKSDKFYDII